MRKWLTTPAVSAEIAENRRRTPTRQARAQRRRSVINRFRPSGKVHTVLSIKSGPRLFPSPLCFGLYLHTTAAALVSHERCSGVPRQLQQRARECCLLVPFAFRTHTSQLYLYFLFTSFALQRQLSLSVIVQSSPDDVVPLLHSCAQCPIWTHDIIRFYTRAATNS